MKWILYIRIGIVVFFTCDLYSSETNMTNISLGLNSVKFKDGTIKDNHSVYASIDAFTKTNKYNIAYGLGFDINALGTAGQSSLNYTLASQLKLGYSLYAMIKYPIHIKTEVGYGVTRFYDRNYWGSQYAISLDANIYENIGIGIKYKYVNTGINLSSYSSYNTNILFLQMSF